MSSKNKTYHNPKCYCIVSRRLITDPCNKRRSVLSHYMIMTVHNTWTTNFFAKNLLTFTTETECKKNIKKLSSIQHKIHSSNGLECDYLIPVMFKNIKLLRRKSHKAPLRWETPYTKEIIEVINDTEKDLKKKKIIQPRQCPSINDIEAKIITIKERDKNPFFSDITPASYDCNKRYIKEEKKLSLEELRRKSEENAKKFFLINSQTKEYLCGFNNMRPYFSKDINDSMYFLRIGEAQSLINKLQDMSYYEFLKDLNLIIVNEAGKQVHLPKPTFDPNSVLNQNIND